jgi:hypothetical protein
MGLSGLSGNSGLTHSKILPRPVDAGATYVATFQGAATHNSITFRAKTSGTSVRIAYSEFSDFREINYSPTVAPTLGIANITIIGLKPDTIYHWSFEDDGKRTSITGRFKTYPLPLTMASFKFVSGSCSRTDSVNSANGTVYQAMIDESPLFFQHLGDMHYYDIGVNDITLYRAAYDKVLSMSNQALLYRSVPTNYMWDDHDYASDNSNTNAAGKEPARLSYRERFPHYPLPAGTGNNPIYHSFTVGRVLFIVTDTRSEKSDHNIADSTTKTVLGAVQKQWFKDTLLAAKSTHKGIVWINSHPFLSTNTADENWGGYPTEQKEICDYIVTNQIPILCIVSGDAHMIAIDNGSGCNYSTNGSGSIPVFHFAPLDHPNGSVKGGTYSHGTFPSGEGQYGLVDIQDTTNYLRLIGAGKRVGSGVLTKHTVYATRWDAINDCYGLPSVTNRALRFFYNTNTFFNTLKDFKTNTALSVGLRLSTSGAGVNFDTGSTAVPSVLASGTEILDTFKNKINLDFITAELTDATSTFLLDLNGLDNTKRYLIEVSCDRYNSTYNGQRGVRITLNGVTVLENLSTTGVVVNSTNSVSFSSGYNSINGYVARWIFTPTAGTAQIVSQQDTSFPSTTKAHPVKFFRLSELL